MLKQIIVKMSFLQNSNISLQNENFEEVRRGRKKKEKTEDNTTAKTEPTEKKKRGRPKKTEQDVTKGIMSKMFNKEDLQTKLLDKQLGSSTLKEEVLIPQYGINSTKVSFKTVIYQDLEKLYKQNLVLKNTSISLVKHLKIAFKNIIEQHQAIYSNTSVETRQSLILKNNFIEKRDKVRDKLCAVFSCFPKSYMMEVEFHLFQRFFQSDMNKYFKQARFLIHSFDHVSLFIHHYKPTPAFVSTLTFEYLHGIKFNSVPMNTVNTELLRAMKLFSKNKDSEYKELCKACVKANREADLVMHFEKNTRSLDEPATLFYMCLNDKCGATWRKG